ncbi:MAG: methyltransferase domain-containing protein [Betaproteobacteria bacterium]|nr:methyltransferase domain-containing protein [Betaproteobacteria bacterium]
MTLARLFATLLAALLAATAANALSEEWPPNQELGDRIYQPTLGQAGKDVIWLPTPDALVVRMLTAAAVTKDDLVYDLGCGDGKIPIAAAKQFGARAVGIEYEADMAQLARRNVARAGVESTVNIITGDIFVEDFTKATVVTLYLLPELNLKLRPTILKMKPGTRVVSHQFHMGDWEPDEHFVVEGRDGYLWYVPASVAGEWTVKQDDGLESTVSLMQRHQKVAGTLTAGGKTQTLLGPSLRGNRLSFSFVDADNNLRAGRFVVAGDSMRGEYNWWGGTRTLATARKR